MTKKQVREMLEKALVVGQPLTEERKNAILDLFKSSTVGKARAIEELIKVENGKTVAILDTVANVWLPATKEFFYEEKDAGKQEPRMNGLKNHSKAREKLVKEHQKLKKHLKDLMWEGVIQTGALTREDINALSAKLPTIDYSRIVPFGKPEAGTIKPSKEVSAFEDMVTKATSAIEAKKNGGDDKPETNKPNTTKENAKPNVQSK